ncbi:MAG TPA: polysaccharide biosynthesis C-terminal domain-containing protein, partial [Actinopolymorphaceae bacterium]
SRVLAADLKGRGRPGMVSIGTGIGVVLVVALDLVLIPAFGMEGAAVAAALAQTVTAAVLLRCYRSVTSGSLGALLPRPSDLTALISRLRNRVSA